MNIIPTCSSNSRFQAALGGRAGTPRSLRCLHWLWEGAGSPWERSQRIPGSMDRAWIYCWSRNPGMVRVGRDPKAHPDPRAGKGRDCSGFWCEATAKRFSRLVGLGLGIFRPRTSRSGASPRVFNSQSPAEPQECQAGLSARPSGIPGQKAALWGIKSLRDSQGLFKAAANGVARLENARHGLLPAPEREKSGAESKKPPNLIFFT